LTEGEYVSYAIIGFGKIGQAFARSGIEVSVATTRDPESFASAAAAIGFSPIKLGGLSEGGLLVQARGNSWGQLIFKDLVKFD
jgi:predicted dinucleotide-binding enzyme